jgi:hypothetical protein
MLEEFHLRIPQEAFKFLFQLYNFVSRTKTVASQSKPAYDRMMFAAMPTKDFQSFTTDGSNDDDGVGTWTTIPRQHQSDQAWDQPYGNDDDGSDDDDGGGTWTTIPRQHRGDQAWDQPYDNDDDGSNDDDGGGTWTTIPRQHQGDRAWDQPYISDALAEKGYYIEGWTPRDLVRHLSVNEILIDIEELIR